jgi:hypothetical protein
MPSNSSSLNLQTWAEAAAWRITRASPGEPADAVLERCLARVQELFQPAFAEVHREDFQVIVAIEDLLDRIQKTDRLAQGATIEPGSERDGGDPHLIPGLEGMTCNSASGAMKGADDVA